MSMPGASMFGPKPPLTSKEDHQIHQIAPDTVLSSTSQSASAMGMDMDINTVVMILGAAALIVWLMKRG